MALLEWLTRRGKGNNSSPERGRMIRGRERLVQPSLRRDKVRRIVERVRQPAEHLARHDLPEVVDRVAPIVQQRRRVLVVVWPHRPEVVAVVEGGSSLPTGSGACPNLMCIVEPGQTFAIRSVECQAVVKPVWFGFRHRHGTHHKTDPMATFRVDHEHLPIQPEQGVEGWVAFHE